MSLHKEISFEVEICRQFHALTSEAQRAIDLLREHRTALISAVTGQIDVRGEVVS